jgi:hypothetical protein
MLDLLLWAVGWNYLTPQGVRCGVAAVLALLVLSPNRFTFFEAFAGFVASFAVGLLLAQAVSLGH